MSYDHTADWASALILLQPHISTAAFRAVALNTELSVYAHDSIYAAHLSYVQPRPTQPAIVRAELTKRLGSMHQPERIELLLWVAVACHMQLAHGLDWRAVRDSDTIQRLCRHAGCAPTNLAEPSIRWLKLHMHTRPQPRFAELAGPWPSLCVVCERPVCSDETNSRIHEHCRDYARIIYKPAVEALRRQEAQATAADLDR